MNEYKLLTKQEDYDLPTVKELAFAMNELAQMEQRRAFLENLIRVNGKLKKHIWKDKNGFAIALADLQDDHLRNIISYWRRRYNDEEQKDSFTFHNLRLNHFCSQNIRNASFKK